LKILLPPPSPLKLTTGGKERLSFPRTECPAGDYVLPNGALFSQWILKAIDNTLPMEGEGSEGHPPHFDRAFEFFRAVALLHAYPEFCNEIRKGTASEFD